VTSRLGTGKSLTIFYSVDSEPSQAQKSLQVISLFKEIFALFTDLDNKKKKGLVQHRCFQFIAGRINLEILQGYTE
jgi:hypothetical protein